MTDGGESLSCRVRGAIRIPGADSGSRTAGAYNTAARLDRPLCGDIVTAERGADARSGASDGSGGVITAIHERRNALIRPPLANIDYIFAAFAAAKPAPVFVPVAAFASAIVRGSVPPAANVTVSSALAI